MSLAETRERYWDNPMGAPGAPSTWMVRFLDVAMRAVWKVGLRFKVVGAENLDAIDATGHGAVVAANHVSFADPPTLFLALRPRSLRVMGKEEVFTKAGWAVAQVGAMSGAFPVKRDSADRTAIKRAVMYLKSGEYVGIFPEGTRMRKQGMTPNYHAGTVLIARMAGVPIVPVGIRNTDKICPNGSHFPRYFQKVTAAIGEPVDPADYEHIDKHVRNEVVLNEVMRAVFALRDGVPVEQEPADVTGVAAACAQKGVEVPELPARPRPKSLKGEGGARDA